MSRVACGFVCLAWISFLPRPTLGSLFLFSIDPASPTIDGDITADDMLAGPPPGVVIQGTELGLRDNTASGELDTLNAFSYGVTPLRLPVFSVDRVAVGLPGSSVFGQSQPGSEEASGDVFVPLPAISSNSLVKDEEDHGLIEGFFGDDLDALVLNRPALRYFSIDFLSLHNNFGSSTFANDIWLEKIGNLYASGEDDIGLDPFDDLDALALDDTYEPGVLNKGIDEAFFSLSSHSPNTFTSGLGGSYSPADVLYTNFNFPDEDFTVAIPANEMGLRADDELNALAITEPTTCVLISLAALFSASLFRNLVTRG